MNTITRIGRSLLVNAFIFSGLAAFALPGPGRASTQGWVEAYNVKLRLLAGGPATPDSKERLAFLEFDLEPGWKTYWRHPGDGGGIPPEFSWAGSENLDSASVLFPQPSRLKDQIGDTIGYKHNVVFPIHFVPTEPRQAINVKLSVRFGICKDICVPLDAELKAKIAPDQSHVLPLHIARAPDRVPRDAAARRPTDPRLVTVSAADTRGEDRIVRFETEHAPETNARDLFLEAPEGLFIPVPKPVSSPSRTRAAFEIALRDDEFKALKGKTLRATIVDSGGSSQRDFKLPD